MNTKANTQANQNGDDAAKLPRKPQRIRRWMIRLVLLPCIVYCGILGLLVANETSLVYPGSRYPKGNWEPEEFSYEEIAFESADGTKLVGWFLPRYPQTQDLETSEQHSKQHSLLFCHGNAENVAESSQWYGENYRRSLNADVFVFDYRGYGKSEGTPFEEGVLQDAEAALNLLCEKTGLQPQDVVIVGSSIGGGPAVYLASKHGCKVLILRRTFTSISGVAAQQFPWLPVRLLMRNQYPSETRIKSFDGPLFQSHGQADTLIPIEMGKTLFEAAPTTNKKFYSVPNMGHLDPLPQEYWGEMAAFVNAVE